MSAALIVMGVAIDRFGQKEREAKGEAIVVLGARVLEDGQPGGSLRARVERGVALFHEGAAPLMVFSGGVGAYPPSEASVARELAISLGVPPQACLIEEESHSTLENARLTARLLHERQIRRVLLVSDPYHLYRARQAFWVSGIDAVPVPALLTGRNVNLLDRAAWTVREVFALLRRPWLLFARRP